MLIAGAGSSQKAFRYESAADGTFPSGPLRMTAVSDQQSFRFGAFVAAHGAWAVISAYKESEADAQEGGAAYLLRGDTQVRVVEPDPSGSAWFGQAVAIASGPRAVIAAPSSDTWRLNGGFVGVYGSLTSQAPTPKPSRSAAC